MKTEEEKGYQGWTNYETWCVKLWIDNEENSYNYWQERAKELKEEGGELITRGLADELKEAFDENNPLEEAGVYTDLLYSALGEVNWYEISESILKEVK
jgi:hypothetical protein